jgi:hypothetical protein
MQKPESIDVGDRYQCVWVSNCACDDRRSSPLSDPDTDCTGIRVRDPRVLLPLAFLTVFPQMKIGESSAVERSKEAVLV